MVSQPVTHLAVCGDSFGVGAGLPYDRCYEDNFTGRVAEHFNLPQKVYARSGCCNFTILLQVRKIIEQVKQDPTYRPLVVITTTFHERLIFPVDGSTDYRMPDLSQVEYMNYPPYSDISPSESRPLEFSIEHEPTLLTETVSNIDQYLRGNIKWADGLFHRVTPNKFEAIKSYITELFDTGVKQQWDNSLFITMHYLLAKHDIPHVIMGHYLHDLQGQPEYMQHDWGHWCKHYPDNMGSGHCNEEGNRLVGEALVKHIEDNSIL